MNRTNIVVSVVVNIAAIFTIFLHSLVMAEDYRQAERKDTVIFDNGGGPVANPENWNPYHKDRRLEQGFHQALMEPLFILNYETDEVIPWLAESYERNRTAVVWTIKLRQGVTWSDGEAMNADDLVFTINLIKNTPELVNAGDINQWVKSVEKVDDLTVRFYLTGSNPRFVLDNFAVKVWGRLNILPEHIWKGKDPLTFTNYEPKKGWPVFTGPYKLASISPTRFIFIRDDNWWGAKVGFKPLPKPKKLMWTAVGGKETRIAAMAINELDSLLDIGVDELLFLQEINPRVTAHYQKPPYSWPDPCVRNIEINHHSAPWNDKALRWALNHAINREEIISYAYKGSTLAARHFFPAYKMLNRYGEKAEEAGLYRKYPILSYDPDKTRAILASKEYRRNKKTGYFEKNGEALSIHIQTPEPFIEKQHVAQMLAKQLRDAGIKATWGNVAYGAFWEKFLTGDYEARIGWQTCASINEPWASMNTFNINWYKPEGERVGATSENGWRWQNKEYSRIVDEIGRLPLGDPRIDALFIKAMDIWLDELPVIPITQAQKIIPFSHTYWTNWPSADNPYIHPPSWWQSAHIIIHNLKPAKPVVKKQKTKLISRVHVVTTQAPPFSYEKGDEIGGIATEVVQAILGEIDAKASINFYPWARAYRAAQEKENTLIYLVERLPTNEDDFKWVGTITPVDTYVYKLKTRKDIQVERIDDMNAYEVGVPRKSGGHQYLEMRGINKLYGVKDVEQSIKMINAGFIDLLLASEASFITQVKSVGLDPELFEKVYHVDELSVDGYLAFSKSTPDDVVKQFREALAQMKARGEYQAILKKHKN